MKKIALVLAAVLLVLMVGACGTKKAGMVETVRYDSQNDLRKLFDNFVGCSIRGLDQNYEKVLDGIKGNTQLSKMDTDEDSQFSFYNNGILQIEDLSATVIFGRNVMGDFLFLYFHVKHNPDIKKLSKITTKVNAMADAAFAMWDEEAMRATIYEGSDTFTVSIGKENTKDKTVTLIISKSNW